MIAWTGLPPAHGHRLSGEPGDALPVSRFDIPGGDNPGAADAGHVGKGQVGIEICLRNTAGGAKFDMGEGTADGLEPGHPAGGLADRLLDDVGVAPEGLAGAQHIIVG